MLPLLFNQLRLLLGYLRRFNHFWIFISRRWLGYCLIIGFIFLWFVFLNTCNLILIHVFQFCLFQSSLSPFFFTLHCQSHWIFGSATLSLPNNFPMPCSQYLLGRARLPTSLTWNFNYLLHLLDFFDNNYWCYSHLLFLLKLLLLLSCFLFFLLLLLNNFLCFLNLFFILWHDFTPLSSLLIDLLLQPLLFPLLFLFQLLFQFRFPLLEELL